MMGRVFLLLFAAFLPNCSGYNSKWHYECTDGYCEKTLITENTTSPLSLAECNILCLDYASVWPQPTGNISIDNLTLIDVSAFSFTSEENTTISSLVEAAFGIFTCQFTLQLPRKPFLRNASSNGSAVQVQFEITDQDTEQLSFGTNESYTVRGLATDDGAINVTITAETFFGARHALETLSQLVVFDDLRNRTLFPASIAVSDQPAFNWRGVCLDTARNYITPKAIKRTLRAMAASKLNTFHWHLTDTASFPYVSSSHPELSEYGAYSSSKVYTDDDVKSIIEYARVRGIRVVPELDSPAHVGEGWQTSGVLTCFNQKPWTDYCAEPPCGQFDPSQSGVYDILEDLYGDLLTQFGTDVFHMGGDEVNVACWNITSNLTAWMVDEMGWGLSKSDFQEKVWPYFQNESAQRLYKQAGAQIPIILWSSDLTALDNVTSILPPEDYIIQIWDSADSSSIQTLLSQNYSVILSNYDGLYLDCGFAGWVTNGTNWCSPYKGWQTVYDNKPVNIAGTSVAQVLGGETVLWTEEAESDTVDSRLWPRAAAFAETLWSAPETTWEAAEERMLFHRERLVALGIGADALQPEWCRRNQQNCPT
uniref:Beta-hexosaminidase n=2 Tax=Dendroctonus ponderosae TaxID=77166 RepID=J3JT78_DENPD|nr:unknown [Dendroctonus ponderosae]